MFSLTTRACRLLFGFASLSHFFLRGVMAAPVDQLTVDGYDLQFGTNCLGHFYFTKLLLPLLIESAKADPVFKARVVNTSSSGHYLSTVDFATLKDSKERRKQGTQTLYAQSKFVSSNLLGA